MKGVEIDFIVKDSLEALDLYEKIFEVQRIEATNLPQGQNEVIFSIYDVRFHMLDANEEYGMNAPTGDTPNTVWFNVTIPEIEPVHKAALDAGCSAIQPITEMMDHGVSNSMFIDPFGYVWMLHQVHREVSFEERVDLYSD